MRRSKNIPACFGSLPVPNRPRTVFSDSQTSMVTFTVLLVHHMIFSGEGTTEKTLREKNFPVGCPRCCIWGWPWKCGTWPATETQPGWRDTYAKNSNRAEEPGSILAGNRVC